VPIQFRNELLSIVQSAIPSKDVARLQNVRLNLHAGFTSRIEGSIEECKIVFADEALPIGPIWRKYGANLSKIFRVNRPSIEVALSKLNTHKSSLANEPTRGALALI
jgi:hypothetical protein